MLGRRLQPAALTDDRFLWLSHVTIEVVPAVLAAPSMPPPDVIGNVSSQEANQEALPQTSNAGGIAGGIIAALLICACLAVAFFMWRKRNMQCKAVLDDGSRCPDHVHKDGLCMHHWRKVEVKQVQVVVESTPTPDPMPEPEPEPEPQEESVVSPPGKPPAPHLIDCAGVTMRVYLSPPSPVDDPVSCYELSVNGKVVRLGSKPVVSEYTMSERNPTLEYRLKSRAFNTLGMASEWSDDLVVPAVLAPDAPPPPRLVDSSDSNICVAVEPSPYSTGKLQEKIYELDVNGTLVVLDGVLEYTLEGRDPSQEYLIRTRAINSFGLVGAWSAQLLVPAMIAPAPPPAPHATRESPSIIHVAIDPSAHSGSAPIKNYEIQVNDRQIVQVDSKTMIYTIEGRDPALEYRFRTRSINSVGLASAWSAYLAIRPIVAAAEKTVAKGRGLHTAVESKQAQFVITAVDADGSWRKSGGDKFQVEIRQMQPPASLRYELYDNGNGTYSCEYVPEVPGQMIISILLDGQHILGSPYTVEVKPAVMEAPPRRPVETVEMPEPVSQPPVNNELLALLAAVQYDLMKPGDVRWAREEKPVGWMMVDANAARSPGRYAKVIRDDTLIPRIEYVDEDPNQLGLRGAIKDNSVSFQALGLGVTLGQKISVSFMDKEVGVDLAKATMTKDADDTSTSVTGPNAAPLSKQSSGLGDWFEEQKMKLTAFGESAFKDFLPPDQASPPKSVYGVQPQSVESSGPTSTESPGGNSFGLGRGVPAREPAQLPSPQKPKPQPFKMEGAASAATLSPQHSQAGDSPQASISATAAMLTATGAIKVTRKVVKREKSKRTTMEF